MELRDVRVYWGVCVGDGVDVGMAIPIQGSAGYLFDCTRDSCGEKERLPFWRLR